jgi:hypothetical protein
MATAAGILVIPLVEDMTATVGVTITAIGMITIAYVVASEKLGMGEDPRRRSQGN